jgi:hypothetical protein
VVSCATQWCLSSALHSSSFLQSLKGVCKWINQSTVCLSGNRKCRCWILYTASQKAARVITEFYLLLVLASWYGVAELSASQRIDRTCKATQVASGAVCRGESTESENVVVSAFIGCIFRYLWHSMKTAGADCTLHLRVHLTVSIQISRVSSLCSRRPTLGRSLYVKLRATSTSQRCNKNNDPFQG